MAAKPAENLPKKDQRPGILLDHLMPENLKVVTLSDSAFRTLIKAWAYCSKAQTDGMIPDQVWRELGPAKARKELLAPPVMAPEKSPLVTQHKGYVTCHDYLCHQRSSDEIEAMRENRRESGKQGGKKSAHTRWHVAKRVVDPECPYCNPDAADAPNPPTS